MTKPRRKVPVGEAFALYVALGHERSIRAVAKHYGVRQRSMQRHAAAERWTERLRDLEAAAQARVEEELVESLAAMKRRQLQTLRVVNTRALEALRDYPLRSAMEAVRALEMSIKLERAIVGADGGDSERSVRELRQREEDSLLDDDDDDGEDDDMPSPADAQFEVLEEMDSAESGEPDDDDEVEAA